MDKLAEREWLWLASILKNKAHLLVGSTIVNSDALTTQNGVIYNAAKDILSRQENVTVESIIYHLNESGLLELAGGNGYIKTLYDITPIEDGLTFKRLAEDIQRAGQVKRVREVLTSIAGNEDEINLDTIIGQVVNQLYSITTIDSEGNVPISESIAKGNTERHAVTSTSLGELDNALSGGGYVPGDYVLVAARPSVGKTAFVLQKALISGLSGNPTLVISLEQTEPTLIGRLLRMTNEETLRDLPIWCNYRRGMSVDQIYYYTQLAKLTDNIKVVIIDYIGLIRGQRGNESRNEFIGRVSQALQTMARKLDVVVIAVSQLNRDPDKEGREPELRDLRDSGSLEQDADIIIFLHRPGKKEMTKIILAKQREGPLGTWVVSFDMDMGMFTEIGE